MIWLLNHVLLLFFPIILFFQWKHNFILHFHRRFWLCLGDCMVRPANGRAQHRYHKIRTHKSNSTSTNTTGGPWGPGLSDRSHWPRQAGKSTFPWLARQPRLSYSTLWWRRKGQFKWTTGTAIFRGRVWAKQRGVGQGFLLAKESQQNVFLTHF